MTKIIGLKEFIREAEMHRSQEHWRRMNERKKKRKSGKDDNVH